MSLFLDADACLSWSLPSITEQQVSPHRLPMQYWLKNHMQAFFKCSPHTNSISNSAILHNNYISLLSELCACVHMKKKWCPKGSHSSSVSGSNHLVWLWTWKKAMGWCTAQWKMLLFCAKNIVKESRKFELARLKKKKKEERKKNISPILRVPGLVLSRCFLAPLGVLLVMKTLDNEWYVVIKAYQLTVLEILRIFFVLSYSACLRYPYIRVYRLYDNIDKFHSKLVYVGLAQARPN